MPTVVVADLEVGAVLSKPVYSPRGVLLAGAGIVVTDAYRAIFRSWGVLDVSIAGETDDEVGHTQSVDAERLADIQQLLDARFMLVAPTHPLMREVRRVAELILVRRAERQGP